jgi:hypothetical protein
MNKDAEVCRQNKESRPSRIAVPATQAFTSRVISTSP